MGRIAIFSDVHGNLPALQTVIEDIAKRGIDQIYCLGDLVDFAPWSNEVIALIKELHIPCLMGNHDERVAFDHAVVPLKQHTAEETLARITAIDHTKGSVSSNHKRFLANLPAQLRITHKVKGKNLNILLVHGSTRSNSEYIYENHDPEDLLYMMQQQQSDVLIMGHTHRSYLRRLPFVNGHLPPMALNCGSVGRSKEGQPLATYLVLNIEEDGIQPELIKLTYPVEKVIQGILESDIPDFYTGLLKADTKLVNG
ncbi:metallophosphoesterase family protein [Chitinophaga agrisoli]|uniref:Metallophosphoesterase family protein n=1 Tax=Chitinophaga agrisoli TaxID=2607653 RepID=A0A5B2VMQ7_9BACT|nr:metallophosphoesterase family protein [Chitinophaga agrisoli]KAA2239577.1 metallophosphoesterase family protein [Chitinophaga agrisoli]